MVSLANEPQGRIRPIVRDFETLGIPPAVTMDILLRRGVFKALAQRRALIALKHQWKARLKQDHAWLALFRDARRRAGESTDIRSVQAGKRLGQAVGRQRARVREHQAAYAALVLIARMPRVSAPDHDRLAQQFVASWRAAPLEDTIPHAPIQISQAAGLRSLSSLS